MKYGATKDNSLIQFSNRIISRNNYQIKTGKLMKQKLVYIFNFTRIGYRFYALPISLTLTVY